MSDLIYKEDAIDTVEELNRKVNDGRENDTICTSDVLRRINALPSIDAVEVVRCENCIFYEKALSVQGFCHNHGSIVSANAFCSYGSYGKRREEGKE